MPIKKGKAKVKNLGAFAEKLSGQHLTALHTSVAPTRRGNYHSTKISKELSQRRQQELRKAEKQCLEHEQQDNHATKSRQPKFKTSSQQPRAVASLPGTYTGCQARE
ncbi:hypothetical protein B0H14DRAFT_2614653 [Mycena olivaceomarginata]|nr:hypothetical protein B0H14DRAFT_2614653 [Mycena olivaceomarginata]